MLVKQIPVNNMLRNYMYIIVCETTKQALAIDPLEYQVCLEIANEHGWKITQIVNTHEHHDHIGGNEGMVKATGATLLAHQNAKNKIANVDVYLKHGDEVKVGKSVVLRVMDTPGHTFCHICMYYEGGNVGVTNGEESNQPPALFCGDTLFNAGAGNCHNGGDPEVLYETFSQQLAVLDDTTLIYPGHDYIENNLRFTLDREPNNFAAKSLLAAILQWNQEQHFISNMALEKMVNTFFRLESETVIAKLRQAFPEMSNSPDAKTVFIKLRELRNSW